MQPDILLSLVHDLQESLLIARRENDVLREQVQNLQAQFDQEKGDE